IGRFGAGILFTNYGTFDETDLLGNTTGSFGANDIALSIAYALPLEENLFVGGAVKFIYSGIGDYSSTGLAADLGVLYTIPESRFSVGASIRNLGAQISAYNTTREDLPLDVGIGASIVPKGLPLLLNVGVHRLTDDADDFLDRFRSFTVGGEFTLSSVVRLRIGYDNARRKDYKIGSSADLAGFSAGLGVLVSGYDVNYALSSLGKAGLLHRVSLSTTF
ncbi:MAG TPA: PorV/PorQ family protein, partial [Bacteroidota bacterium]|nr:PorV/PorQ family protein [Bacteroidota bacterium]